MNCIVPNQPIRCPPTGSPDMTATRFAITALCNCILAGFVNAAYTWPDPQYEALESMFYEGTGVDRFGVSVFVAGCPKRDLTNTTVPAEWLRFAYHDMATFNITAGTGGLDASIYYELDREENIGAGMARTAQELSLSANKYVSRADVIAIAAIWSIAACNGPVLPFRGGRVDSFEAGRKGVPEPQQELKEHVENFHLQGFNATEMIALVACGHTLGGVREEDFPTIVPTNGNPENPQLNTFDSTIQFDTAIATEYISGTTKNPLVVNSNKTVISDFRIFSSDNNATMKSLTDKSTFSQTCSTLLTRMLETVPRGVTLTEQIAPIPFKIAEQRFLFVGGELVFSATFRILEDLSGRDAPPKRTVKMLWCDRRGVNANCADGTANMAIATPSFAFGSGVRGGGDGNKPLFTSGSPVTARLGMAFSFFTASVSVNFERSVADFWFVVTEEGALNATVHDNNGKRYSAVADEIVYLPIGSKEGSQTGTVGQSTKTMSVYIAAGIHNSTKADSVHISAFDNTFLPLVTKSLTDIKPKSLFKKTIPLARNTTIPSVVGYDFYSTEVTNGLGDGVMTADFEANVTDLSSGTKRTVGFDFMFTPTADRVTFSSSPPLSPVSKVNLTSVASGGQLGTPSSDSLSRSITTNLLYYALFMLSSSLIYSSF